MTREYSSIEKFYILLDQFDLPQKVWEGLRKNYSDTKQMIMAISKKDAVAKEIFAENFDKVFENFNRTFIENIIKKLNKSDVFVLTIESENYPEKLKNIDNPPNLLYCKGNEKLLKTKCISVVGMRKVSQKYSQISYEFASVLSKCGFTIVSGMAEGVDKIAHLASLKQKNPTIAVLAGGFDCIYPASHYDLFNKICKNGLVVSEYRPSESVQKYRFILRNRIVAGLSEGTLVTCAGEKSGTYYTAKYAVDYGRELFLIPGDINAPDCKGTNKMITELQGATVLTPLDIIKKLGFELEEVFDEKYDAMPKVADSFDDDNEIVEKQEKISDKIVEKSGNIFENNDEKKKEHIAKKSQNLAKNTSKNKGKTAQSSEENSKTECEILNFLQGGQMHFSQIVKNVNIPQQQILSKLTIYQIEGKVIRLPGNFYELTDR